MNKPARHRLEGWAAALVAGLVAPLPRRLALAAGRALGRLWGQIDRRHRAIAIDNLRQAFPDWPAEQLDLTARAVYAHFGQVLLDVLWLAFRSRRTILRQVEIVGREHVDAALQSGRGALLFTAHIGHWELTAVGHGWTFQPLAVVARPLDNPRLDARLERFRTRSGNTVIYKRQALGPILRRLRANGSVAILVDQNVQEKDGIFVQFFGRPAATTTVAAAVALKTGCALIPGHGELLPDGRCRVTYEPPLVCSPAADRRAEIERLTQAVTSCIERWVRERPEQWLWIHRRWKTQPETARGRDERHTISE